MILKIGCGVALGMVVSGVVLFYVIGALLYPDYLEAGWRRGLAEGRGAPAIERRR